MKNTIMAICCVFAMVSSVESQSIQVGVDLPAVGGYFPDIQFQNVLNYPQNKISMHEFHGKWVILDFWGLGCVACLKGMPRLNDLQQKYANKLQILLIGGGQGNIQPFFESLIAKNHWILPSAFDTSVFRRFNIFAIPYDIWIDPNGIVQALTGGDAVTSENISDFIRGIKFSYEVTPSGKPDNSIRYGQNARSTLGDSIFYFRSTLTPFNHLGGGASFSLDSTRYMMCTGLITMFQMAYNPYISNSKVVLAMKDISPFSGHTPAKYCYELLIPPNRTKDVSNFMQQDLERYFGYRAKMEMLEVQVLSLVSDSMRNLKSLGGPPVDDCSTAGLHLKNQPFSYLIDRLEYYLGDKMPFVCNIHFEEPIDIDLTVNMLDPEEVKKALKLYGLNLTQHKDRIEMLVIYDSGKDN